MRFNLVTDLQENTISSQDRALHYGDGIFETMALHNGQIKYWTYHHERLANSALHLKIPCPDRDWFQQALHGYLNLGQDMIIKIILSRGAGGRGIELPESLEPTVYIFKYPFNNHTNQIVKAIISSKPLPDNPQLAGIKHLNRLDYVMASLELSQFPDNNEAILCDQQGYLVESIVHNLFFVTANHQICTPDLTSCGVNGIMRNLIIEQLKQTQKEVKIGRFRVDDLMQARECFLCNSVQGIRSIASIDQTTFQTGLVTTELQQYFNGQT